MAPIESTSLSTLRRLVRNPSISSRWSLEPSWPEHSNEDNTAVRTIESLLPSLQGQLFTIDDLEVPVTSEITPYILYLLLNEAYEAGDLRLIRKHIKSGQRCLMLGCGIGIISTLMAKISGMPVTCLDANPRLETAIRAIAYSNKVDLRFLCGAIVGGLTSGTVSFCISEEYWSSSLQNRESDVRTVIDVPVINLSSLIFSTDASVVFIDIEGAEEQLFLDYEFPTQVQTIMAEIHRPNIGPTRSAQTMQRLWRQGYTLVDMDGLTSVWQR